MPSQPFDTGWDFGPVLDLIDSDVHIASPSPNKTPLPFAPLSGQTTLKDKTSTRSLRLGDFGKLFAELGITNDRSPSPISSTEPELGDTSSSDDSLGALSNIPEPNNATYQINTGAVENHVSVEDVNTPRSPSEKFNGPIPSGLSKTQRKKWRRKERKKIEVVEAHEAAQSKTTVTQDLEKEKPKQTVKSVPECAISTSTHPMQTRAQSRSNVGAKIRPITPPVKVDIIEDVPVPLATPFEAGTSQSFRALPQTSLPVFATSTFLKPAGLKAQTIDGVETFRIQHSVPASNPLYTTVGTPVPAHISSPSPLVPPPSHTPQTYSSGTYGHGLVPRTVQPVVVQRSQQPVAPPQQAQYPVIPPQPTRIPSRPVGPLTIRPKVARNLQFLNQLFVNFPEDMSWLVAPMQLCNEQRTTEGIHVFVDASNILIGFRWAMKRYHVAPFEISFDSLALLMERRRPVAKRIFAGSHREASPEAYVTKLQEVSKAVGYENNVKEQVFIRREETERKKFFKDVERMGFHKAVEKSQSRRAGTGSGSDSETGSGAVSSPPTAPKWVEQGVDEILHLKMCQSIIDTEVPTTMVLATGDGAQAEHSDGFLAHVERALRKGWKVELVSWRQQTNGGYKNKKWRARWGEQFRIIELDDYLEGLIDTP
ncbi:hypothetical protein P280DRAFT_549889 [Massarina eburnea CBS 473.64]|uniref:NYN domain-containing protein n=1 Tax=Massarina eburnea CBS 473.64 TaxID=1395130 RepID=A0A6A6RZ55_9PLEO|nr:hypothetical protein P280DRAFT_549889 [Massarina eburnea CBS 473.64]